MKHFITLIILASLFASCKAKSPIVTSRNGISKEKISRTEKRNSEKSIDHLIDLATDNVGIKYKYGGTTKAGYDCSGLMFTVFSSENIILPRNSYEQSKIGVVLNQKKDQVQKGDLVFFKTNKSSQINHVGIVIEVFNEEIKFIHSSTSKGVIISSTKEPYYKNTLVQINRIL